MLYKCYTFFHKNPQKRSVSPRVTIQALAQEINRNKHFLRNFSGYCVLSLRQILKFQLLYDKKVYLNKWYLSKNTRAINEI